MFIVQYMVWRNDIKRVYNKLVRDNIINIIKANGEMPIYRILENDEYWECLLKKDAEELLEVKDAQSKEERKKELADKLEVLKAMISTSGFTFDEIIEEAKKKENNNGAFNKKLFLESVIKTDKNV